MVRKGSRVQFPAMAPLETFYIEVFDFCFCPGGFSEEGEAGFDAWIHFETIDVNQIA